MSRSVKIAAAAMLGGLLLALTVGMAIRKDGQSAPIAIPASSHAPDPAKPELRHCRAITTADSGCEAAWEDKRRRFFREDERP